jgi:catechol 2,3-dioxygenase-like lactoylglutathione lyase family enzyme
VFDHVGIRVSDREASERFYTTVLGVLGLTPERGDDYTEWGDLALGTDGPVTRGLHVGFFAGSHELVDEFWRAGVDAGYESDGEPGPRPQYTPAYYGAFLLDPDGNSVEAVFHETTRATGTIDHIWLRVADVRAAAAFYDVIPGFTRGFESEERIQFRGPGSTFSLLAGDRPTEHLHLAFPGSRAQVDAFHATATQAGYRDNGAPGERPQYHPGYYGAFVHDPDGNNVEVVDHGR